MPMVRGKSMYQPDLVEVPLGAPSGGKKSSLSPAYISVASPHCFKLLKQVVAAPLALARLNAGKSSEARMAIIEMTTSNSMSVKAWLSRKHRLASGSILTFSNTRPGTLHAAKVAGELRELK